MRRVEIDIQKRVIQQFTQVDINWNQVLIANELVESRARVLQSKEKLYVRFHIMNLVSSNKGLSCFQRMRRITVSYFLQIFFLNINVKGMVSASIITA